MHVGSPTIIYFVTIIFFLEAWFMPQSDTIAYYKHIQKNMQEVERVSFYLRLHVT